MNDTKPYTLEDLDKELSPYGGARGDALAHYMGDLEPLRVLATVEALDRVTRERDEAREEASNWHSAFSQKAYPSESCRKERDDGNGGCGACAICCHESTQRTEKAEAERDALKAALRDIAKGMTQEDRGCLASEYVVALNRVKKRAREALGEVE